VSVVVISFAWAAWVGGEAMTNRLSTLIEDEPGEVYYSNRGHFLDDTINVLLPKYPLGAGLGRWGMMHYYFADKNDAARGEIWAEIQWTGWLLDGGVPLIVLYCVALLAAFYVAGRAAMSRSEAIGAFGAMVFAYDVGALAMTFNYPIFISQSGMEFWVLNACLYAVWWGSRVKWVPVRTSTMVCVPARARAAINAGPRRPLPALPALPPIPAVGVTS
jgi:hypothetical protein